MNVNAIRYSAFSLLWLSYCLLYFTRKPLGLIKSDLSNKYGYSKITIGILDTALLLPYSFFQIVFGNLGDTINPTKFVSACVIGAGLSTIFLGPIDKLWFIILSLFLSGTFQAFCWPLMVKLVSLLFTASGNQNFVLGIFGTSGFAGGTLGTLLAVFIKDRLTWKWVYPIPSVIVSLTGVALFFFYKCAFKKIINVHRHAKADAVEKEIENGAATGDEKCKGANAKKPSKLAFLSHVKGSIELLWKIPLVFHLAVSNFSLKMIRYILYMWLPYMLEHKNNFSATKAGNITAVFEIGGVVGSIVLGLIIDKCFSRTQFKGVIVMVFAQIGAMFWFIFTTSPHLHWLINTAALLFVGIFIGGIDSLISSSIPLLVTACFKVDACSGVVGLVNGIGTLGTFLEGPLVGLVLHMSSPPRAPPTSPPGGQDLPTADTPVVEGADTVNFVGLFWILGVLSIVPALVLLAGWAQHRLTLNTYCRDRLAAADEPSTPEEIKALDSVVVTQNGVVPTSGRATAILNHPSDASSIRRALLPHDDSAPNGHVTHGGVGTEMTIVPSDSECAPLIVSPLHETEIEIKDGENVKLTGYNENSKDPIA